MRYAIIVLVIFGAVITPDGSGVTMWFIGGPMLALYFAGMFVIERKARVVVKKTQITNTYLISDVRKSI